VRVSSGDPVEDLERALASERERALRALADLENYRKRIQRERQDEHRFRALEPMRELLTVIDNLERALAAPGSVEDLKQGVELILKQMTTMLDNHGVERVEALGREFDPSLHEAVSRDEDADVPRPTVSEELQAGYTMHGRLLRPAVVKVTMPSRAKGEGS
jgi:molecular chaperone GrpE